MIGLLNENQANIQIKYDSMLCLYMVDVGLVDININSRIPFHNVDVMVAARTAQEAMYNAQYHCTIYVPTLSSVIFVAKGYILKK